MPTDVFDGLYRNLPTFSFYDALANVLIAFALGFFISVIYRSTYKGYSYSASFVNTLVIIAMVTSIVIMVIGDNLARAFGLVGAMSIIRFRAAVKDTRDIAFVFFSLAAGMAAGAGNRMIGLTGCFAVGAVILILYFANYGSIHRREMLLRFWMVPEEGEEPVYLPIFNKHLSSHTLLNVRSARLGQFIELSFNVRFKKGEAHREFIREMGATEGLERISLIIGEESENL